MSSQWKNSRTETCEAASNLLEENISQGWLTGDASTDASDTV
jgi:hypothetical protein